MDKHTGNKNYNAILQSALALFRKHGVRRVTVEEICTTAAVSKMTFYRFFKNKNELAEIVLRGMMEDGLQKYKAIMQQDIPFPEKIKQSILLKHETSTDISDEFIKDIYLSNDTGLAIILEQYRDVSVAEVMSDFKTAQKHGWIRKDLKLEFLLYMMNSIGEKMFDEKLAALYANPHDLIMELTNFFFYGILQHSEINHE